MSINILRDYYLEELQKRSANGVHIPEDLLREIDKLTQQVKEFLQESQEEFDLIEKKNNGTNVPFYLDNLFQQCSSKK